MLTKFIRNLFFVLSLFTFITCRKQADVNPRWPEIEIQTKPWTRWWWHGSAVTKEGITAELEAYKKAGLGGVEITPIYGVYGAEEEFIDYLSPEWVDMLLYTLNEAARLGLGIDMATGTGWPFGGPWVSSEDACKNMVYKTWQLADGEQLKEPVIYEQEPFVRAIGNQVYETHGIYKVEGQKNKGTPEKPLLRKDADPIDITELKQPIESNDNLQLLAIDQARFKKKLPLQALMAYAENGEKINLTDKVDKNGVLNWTAPEGNWTLYAVFMGWHGKMVERAAPGGEGNVIDHFSKKALNDYLSKFDSALSGKNISSLRAFFNDSYEVDDARGSANFTPHLFDEFEKRKGYDLLDYLPALFGNDMEELNKRVLCDYRETISALILENFTKVWKEWAHEKGAIVRNQAHGSPANILDLYEVVDIPEMEGEDFLRIKMASSAANVSGKPLTSSESATWLNEHFQSDLSEIKKSLDRFMLSGVNHVFYHGTSYSPPSAPWPGRLFYAAVHLNPRNPLWNDFAALNHYAARCQSFLQNSRPDNDVLLYFPIYDRFSTPGNELIEHFDGVEDRQFGGTAFKESAEFMVENGYSFDYISDKQILKTDFAEGKITTTGGNEYQTLLVPHCDFMPLKTFEKLTALAQQGATVIAFKGLPEDVPGMSNLDERKKKFESLLDKTDAAVTIVDGVSEARTGKGKFLVGSNLDILLQKAGLRRESMIDQGLQFIRKKNKNGVIYFITNWGKGKTNGWVPLNTKARSAYLFNPMTDTYGKAAVRLAGDGTLETYLQLAPLETIIIEAYSSEVGGKAYPIYEQAGSPAPIQGKWEITFISGGPKLPENISADSLQSWTKFGGEAVKNFSGTASYSVDFDMPSGDFQFWKLDLGEVRESVVVVLNGQEIDTLIGTSFKTIVPGNLLKAKNTLTLKVSNLMANRIAYMDKNDIFWKKFYNVNFPARLAENRKNGIFDASNWAPSPSGLLGPVTMTPLKIRTF